MDERSQKEKMEKILLTLGRLFFNIFYIDLQKDIYQVVSSMDEQAEVIAEYYGKMGSASVGFPHFVDEIQDPENREEMRKFCDLQTLEQRLKGRPFISCEYTGKIRGYCRANFIALDEDENGKLLTALFVLQDINETKKRELQYKKIQRHLIEENARDLNERLDTVLAGITGGFKISYDDSERSLKYISESCAAIQGYTPEEMMEHGGSMRMNVIEEDWMEAQRQVREQYEKGDSYAVKYRVRHKDGSIRWLFDSGKRVVGADGEVLHYSLLQDITAKEEADQKLEKQAQQIRQLNDMQERMVETFPMGILAYTIPDHQVLIANNEMYRLFNYDVAVDKSELTHLVMSHVLPEDKTIIREVAKQVKNIGDEVSYTFRTTLKDGKIAHVFCTTRLLAFDDGRRYIISGMRDISQEIELNNQLNTERMQFRDALVRDAAYYFTWDVTDGMIREDIVTADGSNFLKKLGLSLPADYDEASRYYIEQANIQFLDRYVKNCFSCEGVRRIYREQLGNRGMEYYEQENDTYIRLQMFFITDSESGHLLCTFIYTDITLEKKREIEQKKVMQERLQLQKQMLAEQAEAHRRDAILQILGNEYTSVFYIDLAKNRGIPFRLAERHAEKLGLHNGQEFAFQEISERYIRHMVVAEDQEKILGMTSPGVLPQYLEKNEIFKHLYRVKGPDGDLYAQMIVAKVPEEIETEHVVIGLSIVDKKVREEQEKQTLLRNALAQAERANKAKTVFLNNMSHDIRTPMNAIIGYTAMASTHVEEKDKVLDCLKKIQTSSNHLLSLINDVLDMSRIESGKVKIEESETRLPEVMHDIKNIVQADVRAKQLELFFDTVDVIDECVWCDKLRLNQALLNCLSNAIKFTPAGGTIGIKIVQLPCDKEGYVAFEFKVRDTGIGIDPDFIDRIFEPFERENSSTVSGIQGTGLGLSITKNIVTMMGGTISVESEKGKGTEFTIALRLRRASSERVDYRIPELKGTRALVADDSYDTCTSVGDMLRSIGLRPDWTLSGKEAVLRVQDAVKNNDPYGVYIIDWLMPDMNGIEVVRRIRTEIGNDTPIIILTAYDWTDIEDEAKEAGVTAFCAKPLFLSELRSILEKASRGYTEEEREKKKPNILMDNLHILLAEDNEMNREITVEILEENGATVAIAMNGEQALRMMEQAKEGEYDVVLMDGQMPVMDGYEAAQKIRALKEPFRANIPIIACTANAFEEDKKLAYESGMDAHVSKPIRFEVLIETINEIMRKRSET